jgi:hypothetical protein
LYAGVVLAVTVLAVELAAKVVIFRSLGISRSNYDSYYLRDRDLSRLTWSLEYSPHPYFGYESPAIRRFEAERDRRSKADYVIGVLGGSVAASFADYASRHLEYFEPLRDALPNLGDKRLVIANLALGAGHQPQQYFIAAFFLEDVDLFINIEGFNEIRIRNSLPVYPLEFPSALIRSYERTAKGRVYRWLAWPIITAYRAMNWLPVQVPIISRSNFYFSLWYVVAPRLYAAVRYLERSYYKAAIRNGDTSKRRLSDEEVWSARFKCGDATRASKMR